MKQRKIKLLGTASLIMAIMMPNLAAATAGGQDNRVGWKPVLDLKLTEKPKDFAYSLDGKYTFVLTESNRVAVYNQKGELQGQIPVDAGVSSIGVAPRGEFLYLLDSDKNVLSGLVVNFTVDIDITGSHFKGAADAPVVVAVFSDFE